MTGLAGTGKTSTIECLAAPASSRIAICRPSDAIRQYASGRYIPLASRADYNRVHDEMLAQDPDAMTRPILEAARTHTLVIIDGLRVYKHAQLLAKELGGQYKTAVMTCPDEIRAERILRDQTRLARDSATPHTVTEVLQDEQCVLDTWYEFPHVLAMHDLTPKPIDTSQYSTPEAAAQIALALRPLISY